MKTKTARRGCGRAPFQKHLAAAVGSAVSDDPAGALPLICLILFNYLPMTGLYMAFTNFTPQGQRIPPGPAGRRVCGAGLV